MTNWFRGWIWGVITAMEARGLTRVSYNEVGTVPRKVRRTCLIGRGDSPGSPQSGTRPGEMGAVVFPPQQLESLLVLLRSFPHCLGVVVFDLPRPMGIELLGVLGAKLNPFARPSSPCSSGHS